MSRRCGAANEVSAGAWAVTAAVIPKTRITKTAVDKHKQRLCSESLTALESSLEPEVEDKPWFAHCSISYALD
jgi:hypothetical protein